MSIIGPCAQFAMSKNVYSAVLNYAGLSLFLRAARPGHKQYAAQLIKRGLYGINDFV